MIPLEQYYREDLSLEDAIAQLSDPSLSFEWQREDVNGLVMNLVAKYLYRYMQVVTDELPQYHLKEGFLAAREQIVQLIRHRSEWAQRKKRNQIEGGYPVFSQGDTHNDAFALECLSDMRGTAALVKEVIFSGDFKKTEQGFVGLDIGSGTGILLLALKIAAQRVGIADLRLHGVELQTDAVRFSQQALAGICDEAEVHQYDVMLPAFASWLADTFGSNGVQYVVSETFGYSTPRIDLSQDSLGLPPWGLGAFAHIDPFPEVMKMLQQAWPFFLKDVRTGKTALFPDVVHGLYRPNRIASSLFLLTGPREVGLLDEVGNEFRDYENLQEEASRFPSVDKLSSTAPFSPLAHLLGLG